MVRRFYVARDLCMKPYVKTNKSDYVDAEAIAEAVSRPTMCFVPYQDR